MLFFSTLNWSSRLPIFEYILLISFLFSFVLDLRLEIKEESSLENYKSVKNTRNRINNRSRDLPKTSTHFDLAFHKQTWKDQKNLTSKNKKMNAYELAQ